LIFNAVDAVIGVFDAVDDTVDAFLLGVGAPTGRFIHARTYVAASAFIRMG
jgi:hypothetical protein